MSTPNPHDDDQIIPFEPPAETDEAPLRSPLHPTFEECDDDSLLELGDDYWEALIPDDDYETLPEEGDFWIDHEAA
jgi:hypothetical protein